MRRTLGIVIAAGLAAACSREHGAAPEGTFAPGGPVDDRGNAAASRALRGGSAEAPIVPDDPEAIVLRPPDEPTGPERIADRQDAGAIAEAPILGRSEGVEGRIVSADEEELRIEPAHGEPVSLRIDETAQVTLDGSLVSREEIRQGARVRASYRMEDGRPIVENVELLRLPGAEPPAPLPPAPSEVQAGE